jgi:hypothetical protein
MLLPSKAISYLQLPIPRLALVSDGTADALTEYLADKSGWEVVCVTDPEGHDRIRRHLARTWTAEDLAPPEAEGWEHVVRDVRGFLEEVFRQRSAQVSSA